MSSTNKTANYQLSQFVGTDIPSILNDYNGDMRKIDSAIHNASVAGGDNASAIAELQSSTARMSTEIGGINSTVNTLSGKVVGIEEVIPATASAQNKLLTAQELPEIPSVTELEEDVAELQGDVSNIETDVNNIKACVPANASASNKLATMADVSSSSLKLLHTFSHADYSTYKDMMQAINTWLNDNEHPNNTLGNYGLFIMVGTKLFSYGDAGTFNFMSNIGSEIEIITLSRTSVSGKYAYNTSLNIPATSDNITGNTSDYTNITVSNDFVVYSV